MFLLRCKLLDAIGVSNCEIISLMNGLVRHSALVWHKIPDIGVEMYPP